MNFSQIVFNKILTFLIVFTFFALGCSQRLQAPLEKTDSASLAGSSDALFAAEVQNEASLATVTENLLENGGFEEALNSYSVQGYATFSSRVTFEGDSALRLGRQAGSATQSILNKVSAGQSYRFSVRARMMKASDLGSVGVRFLNAQGATIKQDFLPVAGNRFNLYKVNFTVPTGATSGYIYIQKNAGVDYMYADEARLISVSTSTPTPTPTPTPSPAPVPSQIVGIQKIMTRVNTSFCADIDIEIFKNGEQLYIYQCVEIANQNFEFTSSGQIKVHGKCLDAANGQNGDPLIVNDCNGSDKQKFSYESSTGLLKTVNNLCINLVDGIAANRTKLNLMTCDVNNANERFFVVAHDGGQTPTPTPAPSPVAQTGTFRLLSKINTAYCADIDVTIASNGARLYIYQCIEGNLNQAFEFTSAGDIRIHGKCLTSASAENGAQLVVQDCNGSANQKFSYDSSASMIRGVNNLCVDVFAGQMVNRTNLNMYTCDANNANQKFNVVSYATYQVPAPAPTPTPAPQPNPTPATGIDSFLPSIANPIPVGSIQMTCNEERRFAGPFYVDNNKWGAAGTYPSEQCAGIGGIAADGSVSAKWRWNYSAGPNEVKGYPSIGYGQKPGYERTPGSKLPMRVNDLRVAQTGWNTSGGGTTGLGHNSYDIWLTRDPNYYGGFLNTPITHEIMISTNNWGGYGDGVNPAWMFEPEVIIDGRRFRVSKADGFGVGNRWRFIVFKMIDDYPIGSVNFIKFIEYMKQKGLISGEEYMTSIEYGTEPEEGMGEVNVHGFKVDFQ